MKRCDKCKRQGAISQRNELPISPILEFELFDVWGMDFMSPFMRSYGQKYILAQNVDDVLWAYGTAYILSIGMSSYQLVFGKACHLPVEHELKALRKLKKLNLSWSDATNLRLDQINEI
ncbi:hypothetical protein MTR67_048122 [Solanum verrucosum]|uniref:Uncharacterized protein n=1 Tax=Solanum verrucosum TaxID=315347 RepID=A0AAF0ZW74_SOLVR|nr:hypothetical protein MTR67_048122 [Solanum verrucosum]